MSDATATASRPAEARSAPPEDRWHRLVAPLLAFSVAGYPLASALPLILGVPSRVTSIPYRGVILVYSLALIALVGVARGRFYRGLFWAPFAVFWTMYLLRLFLDVVYLPVQLRLAGSEYFLYAVGVCLIPTLALMMRVDDATLASARRWTLGVAASACAIALWLNVSALMSGDLESIQNMRLASETLNPISLGNLGVTVAILALFLLLGRARVAPARALGLIALLVLGLLTAGLSASRGPVLALVLALPALLWIGVRNRARVRAGVLIAAVVVGGIAGAIYIEREFGFGIVTRIEAVLAFKGDDSSQERLTLYRDAWSQFLENPALGSSLDERNSTYHPHNPVIESFMATGLLGGSAFVLILLSGVAAALRLLWLAPRHGWLALIYAQYLLSALLSGSLYWGAEMWTLTGATVAVGFGSLVAPDDARVPAESAASTAAD